ncbi:MAG: Holliday junction branch migration protein RuvA [Patescibacteria group bacterium]
MISYLSGQALINNDELTILVNGVGYHVLVNNLLLNKLSKLTEAELFIYTHVKEEALELYGFENFQDKQIFQLLISVNGVGPKTAINMFNSGSEAIVEAIKQTNVSFFKAVPRVGKKVAQKIIIDLKSKVGGIKDLDLGPMSNAEQEAAEALQALGFEADKISLALQEIDREGMSVEELVREGIRKVSNGQ